MRRQVSISIAAAMALTACGGGGGSSAPPPPPQNAAVDGIWGSSYTNSAGNAADSVILATADGNYFSVGIDTVSKCEGVGYGTLTSNVNDLTLSGSVLLGTPCTFADGTSTATLSGSGTIQPAASITLTTLTLKSSMGNSYPADWLGQSMTLDPLYNEASSFAKVTGTYNVTSNGTVLGVITVAADGTFTYGPDTTGCSASGSLSIIDAQHAIMGFTADFVSCGALGAGMAGDAVLVDTVNPAYLLAIFKNSTAVGAIVATQ